MQRDYSKLKTRKKLWFNMGWTYIGQSLFKNHSLNCGCGICKAKTKMKRYKHKQERRSFNQNINKLLEE